MNANSPAFIPDKLYDSGGCSPGGARGVLGRDARRTFQKLRKWFHFKWSTASWEPREYGFGAFRDEKNWQELEIFYNQLIYNFVLFAPGIYNAWT